ncbi:PadR family transcriptional regulator [Mycoplasmatota bacterium WC30]
MDVFGDLLRGHSDMILLSILIEEDSYGYMINKKIEEITQEKFTFTEATLYTSFKRLVNMGYLTTYWLESESGKKRKYYSITNTGKEYLTNKKDAWVQMQEVINKIVNK